MSECTACGVTCPKDARFCDACGAPLPDRASDFPSGLKCLERYELRGVLGRGATGVVYLGWDKKDSRLVAVKALDPSLAGLPGFLERFRAEAGALRSLSHPNIVALYDYQEEEGRAWLVSERVEGASLGVVLARAGRLQPEQALGVLVGALSGLERAHDEGLVHGDIKPSNILVDRHGVSKLADFGQAIAAGQSTRGGTPAYMSPEGARGEAMDARSDIYSVGVVLWESLTGALPFTAGSDLALLRMQANETAQRASGLHPRLAELLEHALAKDPAERPQSAAELLQQLEAAAVAAYGGEWRRRAAMEMAIASVTAGAGVLGVGPAAAAGALSLPSAGAAATSGAGVPSSAPVSAGVKGGQVATRAGRVAHMLGAHKTAATVLTAAVIGAAGTGALIAKTVQSHTAASKPTVYFFTNPATPIDSHNPLVARPSGFPLFQDGQWILEKLHWTGWGSSVARGTGLSSSSNDIPNAAEGKRILTPAEVVLSKPGWFHGHEVYRCLRLNVPPPASYPYSCLQELEGNVILLTSPGSGKPI